MAVYYQINILQIPCQFLMDLLTKKMWFFLFFLLTFRIANNNGHLPKDLALSCSNGPCALYIQQVDGALHNPNGFASNHLCRKRGTDDFVNGDLKKARTENGSSGETCSETASKIPRFFFHVWEWSF